MIKYSFRFVCQGGGLDMKSAVLAASLVKNLRCHFELVACIPEDSYSEHPETGIIRLMEEMDVRIVKISNPVSEDYPIGNKLACLSLNSTCSHRVFLDSDILCLKPFYGFPVTDDVELAAKLEDWNHHTLNEWTKLYQFLGLGQPSVNFKSTVLDQEMPLYFNAGVIVVKESSPIPTKWITMANCIDNNIDLPRKRPNLDQLSLAGLIVRNSYKYSLLDESYNYPAELRSLDYHDIPYFCHYHDPLMILGDAYLSGFVSRLCLENETLNKIIRDTGRWKWKQIAYSPISPLHV